MSFDGDISRYTAKPEADVFSVEALRDWLMTRNPAETYCFTDNDDCLIARYLIAQGWRVSVAPTFVFVYRGGEDARVFLPSEMNDVAQRHPRTFGRALARCNAYLAERGR